MNTARRKFLSEWMLIFMAKSIGQVQPSFLAIEISKFEMSSCDGAGIRTPRQRDRKGSIIFDGELQTRIIRHCDEYLYGKIIKNNLGIHSRIFKLKLET